MGLLKNLRKLIETIPACKTALRQLDEIVLNLLKDNPLAKSKDIRQQVLEVQRQSNKFAADMKKAYDPGPTVVTDRFPPMEQILKDKSTINKPKTNPPTGGGYNGGGNNPNNGGPMLGGGGLGPLWK